MKTVFWLFLIVCVGGLLWIRFAPMDRTAVHVDPSEVADPGSRGVRFVGPDAPVFRGSPDAVLQAFADMALKRNRVSLGAGDVESGMMTFIVRTKYLGFQDYMTVKAVEEGQNTRLTIASRSLHSVGSDWGLNRKRLEKWLLELAERLGEAG